MNEQDITIYRGDNETLQLQVTRSNIPLNISGAKMWFSAKRSVTDSDANAIVYKTSDSPSEITFTNPAQGQAEIHIDALDTAGLQIPTNIVERDKERYVHSLHYDIQIKLGTGEVFTVGRGKLLVAPDITQATA